MMNNKNYSLGFLLILAIVMTIYSSCNDRNGQSVDVDPLPTNTPFVIQDPASLTPTLKPTATATSTATNTPTQTATNTAVPTETATSTPSPTLTATPTETATPTAEPELVIICEADGTETVLVPTLPVLRAESQSKQPEPEITANADAYPYPAPQALPTLDPGDGPDSIPERPPVATVTP